MRLSSLVRLDARCHNIKWLYASTGHLEDRLGQPLDVARRDARHRYPAVLGSVDRMLLGQSLHLFGFQAGVGEHADLLDKAEAAS